MTVKLNYPTNNIHLDFAPIVDYMADEFRQKIPRFVLEWEYKSNSTGDLQSLVRAEVNAETKTLESFYYDDRAYWGSRPPIKVPISTKN